MTTLANSFEGGSSGTTISTGNSGGNSGNAFDVVAISGAGNTLTYSNAEGVHGPVSAQVVKAGTAGNAYVAWTTSLTISSLTQVWFRIYFYCTAYQASGSAKLVSVQSGASGCGFIVMNNSGKLFMEDQAGVTQGSLFTNAIPKNAWCRIEGTLVTDPAAGSITVSLYKSADSTTATETQTASGINTLSSLNAIRFGDPSSVTTINYWFDDVGASDSGPLGPAPPGPGPASLGYPVRTRVPQIAPRGRVASNKGAPPAIKLTNSFEGGTNTTSITAGNSGGTSGSAFDAVFNGTGTSIVFDNTRAAHGSLSAKVTVGSTATTTLLEWTTSEGTQTTVYFRCYLYFTGNPGALSRPFRAQTAGTGSGVQFTSGGQIQLYNANVTTVGTFATALPLNQWFRVEGFVTGDASAGVVSASLFTPMDSQVPVETQTATGLNTGTLTQYWFGNAGSTANAGTYWMDDIGLSSTGPLGPVSFPGSASLGKPVHPKGNGLPPRGRTASNRGATVRNPTPGPVFRQAVQPARTRIPQVAPRGRTASSLGVAVRSPTSGPVFRQAVQPVRARIPQRRAGGLVTANQHTPPYVPPNPPSPPAPVAPALDASPLPSLITTFPGTT